MMDSDIEQNFLGSLILMGSKENPTEIARFTESVTDDDFAVMGHARIFGAIKRRVRANDNYDLILISDDLNNEYRENAPAFSYLGEIAKNATSAASIGSYIKQMKSRSIKRKGLEVARKIYDSIGESDDVSAALGAAESMIQSLMDKAVAGQSGFRHISDLMTEYVNQFEYDLKNPDEITGVSTGYDGFDKILGRDRLKRGSLAVIGARPAMGKTSYMIGLIAHQSERGNQSQSLVYSLEMPSVQLVDRMVSYGTGFSYDEMLRKATHEDADYIFARMADYGGQLNQSEIYINDTANIRVEQIAMEAREMARKKPIDIIAVDYLTLIQAPDAERNDLRVGEVTKALKRLAKELDCVVVLLSQLSRDLEKRRDKRPVNSDLRDSGQIEQDADYIVMLYRDQVYNERTGLGNLAEAIMTKNRHGKMGTAYHNFEHGRWVDIDQEEGERIYQSNANYNDDNGLI